MDEGPALPQSCVLLWAPLKTPSDCVRAALRLGVCRLRGPAAGGRGAGGSLSGMGVSPTLQAVASLTLTPHWLAGRCHTEASEALPLPAHQTSQHGVTDVTGPCDMRPVGWSASLQTVCSQRARGEGVRVCRARSRQTASRGPCTLVQRKGVRG